MGQNQGVLFFNNLGCVHLQVCLPEERVLRRPFSMCLPVNIPTAAPLPVPQMGKANLASLYFAKALALNESHCGRTQNAESVTVGVSAWSTVISINLQLSFPALFYLFVSTPRAPFTFRIHPRPRPPTSVRTSGVFE